MNVLIVDDDDELRAVLSRELHRLGHTIIEAPNAAEGLRRAEEDRPDVALLDLSLPDLPGVEVLKRLRAERPELEVIVLTAHGTVETALAAMRLGAYDYLQKPCALQVVEIALRRAYERHRLNEENQRLKDGLHASRGLGDLIGAGPEFEELKRLVVKVAASDSTVLIRGETGTGKDLVAAAIHRASPRSAQPFVVVDCASLNENLLQSELFGHERGAFTGAVKLRHGLFEAADGGTIFLDEVGDVTPTVQAGLLRVLETATFRRLGGSREIKVNVRLIAATNRDLERLIRAQQFREDLFFRLNAINIALPPLRRRPGDIDRLAEHFVARHNARSGAAKRLAPETLDALRGYAWPGNCRELRHAVERAVVLAEGDLIEPRDLPPEVRLPAREEERLPRSAPLTLVELERRHIQEVLAQVGGHRARAAAILGISERNLYRRISEYHLDSPGESGRDEGPTGPPSADPPARSSLPQD